VTTSAIHHQIGVKATPDQIFQTLTAVDKLARWWTTDTRGGGARVGDTLEFWFGEMCQKFAVSELVRDKRVVWRSPRGQGVDEWEDTEVRFELSTDEHQTFVRFQHDGWRERTPLQGHCSMRWAVFLLSLKDVLERGKGRPFPYDLEIDYR